MSVRDGVADADYDRLRATGLSREQCWAVLSCMRDPLFAPNPAEDEENRRNSGVRMPLDPSPPGPRASPDPSA